MSYRSYGRQANRGLRLGHPCTTEALPRPVCTLVCLSPWQFVCSSGRGVPLRQLHPPDAIWHEVIVTEVVCLPSRTCSTFALAMANGLVREVWVLDRFVRPRCSHDSVVHKAVSSIMHSLISSVNNLYEGHRARDLEFQAKSKRTTRKTESAFDLRGRPDSQRR